jgi:hypothetical protein
VSRTDDAGLRVGLGWEVWFLLTLLAGAAIAAFFTMSVLGFALDVPVSQHVTNLTRQPDLDPRRLLTGLTVTAACAIVATIVVRTTDWHRD